MCVCREGGGGRWGGGGVGGGESSDCTTVTDDKSELRSCVKVLVDVLSSPLPVRTVSVDVKQH